MANGTRRPPAPESTVDSLIRHAVERGIHIHVHLHDDASDEHQIGPMLERIFKELRALRAQGVTDMATVAEIQAKLTELQSSVEGETDLTEAVKTLLEGQNALLLDLRTQLAEAIKNNDPAALQAVLEMITAITTTNAANAEKTAAALLANTPAAPEPPSAGQSRRSTR